MDTKELVPSLHIKGEMKELTDHAADTPTGEPAQEQSAREPSGRASVVEEEPPHEVGDLIHTVKKSPWSTLAELSESGLARMNVVCASRRAVALT